MADRSAQKVVELIKDVVQKECRSLEILKATISTETAVTVSSLLACDGRIAVSGVGKAGLIGRKISATFASTGIASYWLDPVNALHGDLGMVSESDQVLLLSNSGSSRELILTAQALGNLGIHRIAMTQSVDTPLAQMCEAVLTIGEHREADPYNLVPTCSTIAMLAMGDAIALALHELRGGTKEEFGRYHPAGALGRRLMKVSQCMRSKKRIAQVNENVSIAEAMHLTTAKQCGLAIIVDQKNRLKGVFTDGDFRRCWEEKVDFRTAVGIEMTSPCKSIHHKALVEDALQVMRRFRINAVPVVDSQQVVLGMLDIQDVA